MINPDPARFGQVSTGLVAVILVVLCLTVVAAFMRSHDHQVKAWAEERGYSVVSIERVHLVNDSPFFRMKNDDLLRATLSRDGRAKLSYHRWTILGMDQAWGEDK